jgi:hypothetical protein
MRRMASARTRSLQVVSGGGAGAAGAGVQGCREAATRHRRCGRQVGSDELVVRRPVREEALGEVDVGRAVHAPHRGHPDIVRARGGGAAAEVGAYPSVHVDAALADVLLPFGRTTCARQPKGRMPMTMGGKSRSDYSLQATGGSSLPVLPADETARLRLGFTLAPVAVTSAIASHCCSLPTLCTSRASAQTFCWR